MLFYPLPYELLSVLNIIKIAIFIKQKMANLHILSIKKWQNITFYHDKNGKGLQFCHFCME